MIDDMKILELMNTPSSQHDLDWLKDSLQAAIELEFSTIPPYLCAWWSIKDRRDPTAVSIREIALEEMLHMALVCNLLNGIGGSPILNDPAHLASYPGPLPGGVHPGLIMNLQGLTKASVQLFMQIEYPEAGPVAFRAARGEEFSSIGEFYRAVMTAFEKLQPSLNEDRQLQEPGFGLQTLRTLSDVRWAIDLIRHQGEGSQESPEDTGPDDLAHYYRFAQIYHGRALRKDPVSNTWKFDGDEVPFPEAWPMAPIPSGGYQQGDVPAPVWTLLADSDRHFSTMLNHLQRAWADVDLDALGEAVDSMFLLRGPAVQLMQIPTPSGDKTYGPGFRFSA